jgi:lysophospholipase L1-like esterase
MDWYEPEARELIARLAGMAVPHPAVVYGSSSVRLWTTMAEDLKNVRAVNAGFGGSTLEACVYFFERIVPPLAPASLVVYAGDNDLGDGRSADQVVESFRQLAVRVDRRCGPIPFGFMSIKPSPARADILDRIRRTNELIRTELERRPSGFYIPLFDAMLQNGKPRPELFLEDGLHLGPLGYELWTQLLEPFRHQIFDPNLDLGKAQPPTSRTSKQTCDKPDKTPPRSPSGE